jgi:hypothetical protein
MMNDDNDCDDGGCYADLYEPDERDGLDAFDGQWDVCPCCNQCRYLDCPLRLPHKHLVNIVVGEHK